jgi:serine/threonine protein kinase
MLSPDQTAAIESHVASCNECCQALLSVADDSLVSRLKGAVSTSSDSLAAPEAATLAPTGLESPPPGAPLALPPELASHPRYRVDKLLGTGGMGAVYKAYHRVMDRPVALKIINPNVMTKPGMVERFTREVQTAARLSHPNIVAAFDAEQAGGVHFLVMEYVDGTDLGRLVQERGPLPVDRACDYVRQAALGLQHAFEQGMVHRDIKPHNLMLAVRSDRIHAVTATEPDESGHYEQGTIKILDFGLARFASEAASEAGVTASGMVLGTVDYIAPEQADNAHEADIRSDIYSLGCTLYHLLAGRPPFPAGTPIQKVMAHVEKTPQPLTDLRQDIQEELMLTLERMMAKNPRHRYQTPIEVAYALERFTMATADARARKSGRRLPATVGNETVLLENQSVRHARRRKFMIAAAILCFLVAGLLGGVVYRIQTDKGELVITTESDDVKVVITQGGKLVDIIDTETDKQISLSLRSGVYELELKDAPKGLKLDLKEATLRRGEKTLARIERVVNGLLPPSSQPEKSGEVFRKRWEDTIQNVGVDLSPDGRLLLSCHYRNKARVWHVSSGKVVHELVGHIAKFTPDGKYIVTALQDFPDHSGDWLRVYDTESGEIVRTFGKEGFWYLRMNLDSRTMVTGGVDKIGRLWDWTTGEKLLSWREGERGPGSIYTWGKDMDKFEKLAGVPVNHVLPGGREVMGPPEGRAFPIYETSSGLLVRKASLEGAGPILTWAAGYGTRVSVSLPDRTVCVLDLLSGKEVARYSAGNFQPNCLAISADGRCAAACTYHEKSDLVVWRVPDPPATKVKP